MPMFETVAVFEGSSPIDRYLQSNDSNVPENMVYEYDDFYFCPDPEYFVYSHFPEDPKWQLLKQPLR